MTASLWWIVREEGSSWPATEILAGTAEAAAREAALAWFERDPEEWGGPCDEVALVVEPHPGDAADDPWRCYERAGGGGRFVVRRAD